MEELILNQEFLGYKLDALINQLDAKQQEKCQRYKSLFSNPDTVDDLLKVLNFCIANQLTDSIPCLMFIGVLKREEFFPVLVELAKTAREKLHAEYALQEITAIPGAETTKVYLPIIIDLIIQRNDPNIYFQGFNLLYRIFKESPETYNSFPEESLVLDKEDIIGVIDYINHLNELSSIGIYKSPYKYSLESPEIFVEFISKFVLVRE